MTKYITEREIAQGKSYPGLKVRFTSTFTKTYISINDVNVSDWPLEVRHDLKQYGTKSKYFNEKTGKPEL